METLPVQSCYRGETNEALRKRFRVEGMEMQRITMTISASLLAACNAQPAENQTNVQQPVAVNQPVAAPDVNASMPAENASLPEPKGPIDPTSAEAAGQVVQHYGALIEQGRWTESW